MPRSIRWVFLDIGNTLVNDYPSMLMFYQMLRDAIRANNLSCDFARLMREREQLINGRRARPWATLSRTYLGQEGWEQLRARFLAENGEKYIHYNPPMAGVTETLAALSEDYRLGVAANQGLSCRAALSQLGWLEYFDLLWISDEVGTRKPEREFFTGLLAAAGCQPRQAVMIGDRIDADIRPAHELGMRAIHAKVSPGLPDAYNSAEANLYRASLARARIGNLPPADEMDTPDAVVTAIDQIPAAVERLQSG